MNLKNLRQSGGIGGWVRWSIREKGIVAFLVLALMGVGLFGLEKMSKDEFPTFQIKQGLVAGIYPGATAAEVEQQLAVPIEEYLFGFNEINRETLRSVSRDGICYLYADLRADIPQSRKDEVWSKIKLGLQAKKQTLPPGVLAIAVLDDFGTTSSLLISLESSDKSYFELQDYAEELCTRLRKLPKLAKAAVLGAQQEEIAVILDREKISAYGIDPGKLMLDYRASSLPVPAGSFVHGHTREAVHVHNTVEDEREVAGRIVYADPDGNVVRLKDVAEVERRCKAPEEFVSCNGHACLVVNVEMRPDNDIVSFGRDVDAVLHEYGMELPDSVHIGKVSDQPSVVRKSVWSFLRDLVISMLVVIFVMLMLFPMRSALIASSGVPVCTAITIAAMYMTGIPLNTVTLAALIVVLGMIVDDSIITMDGYMEFSSRGLKGVDAAASSARELFMPTFIATLAICLMFFPIKGIITGYLGDFVSLFPWVILIALMTSLFYAVTVVPSLEVRFINTDGQESERNIIRRVQDRFFDLLQRFYERCLNFCFRHPAGTLAGGAAAILLGVLMFSRLNIQMMPMAARDFFVIEMYLQAGNGISRTKEHADSLQRMLLADRRIKSVTAFVGTGAPRFAATYAPILPSAQTAQIIVSTTSSRSTEEILREYGPRCEHMFADALIRFKQMDYQAVDAPVSVRLSGERREDLIDAAGRISAFLKGMDGQTQWVHSDADDFEPIVNISLDEDESSRLGVSKAMLSLSLAGTFDGTTIATLWENGRQIPVNLYSEGTGPDMDYSAIGNRLVHTSMPGVSVPLRQVADIGPDWQLARLCRENGRQTVTVSCDLRPGVSQPAILRGLKKFIREEIEPSLPENAEIQYGGLSASNRQVVPEIGWSFAAACFILFIFLLIHFRKANIAVLTMVLSLLCLFGASFGLWIFGLDFSITAVLGLISLVGIIVRNGILMFEYAENARFNEGKDVKTASLLAGQRRMRPIFLTSCTTALGVLPMILSGDLLWMPMGVTICFGTMLSIFLITLIMPISYWQLFRNADNK